MSVVERARGEDLIVKPAPTRQIPWAKARIVLVDVLVIAASLLIGAVIVPAGSHGRWAIGLALVAAPLWLSQARLYSARFISRRSDELRRVFSATLLTATTVCVAAYWFGWSLSRSWVLTSFAMTVAALSLSREFFRRRFDKLRRDGHYRRPVLLVGDNDEGQQFLQMFVDFPEIGYDVSETISPADHSDPTALTTAVLAAAHKHGVSGVVIAATALEVGETNRLIRDLLERGIHVELSSTLADIAHNRLTVRPLGVYPMMYIEAVQRSGWRAVAKRSFDLALSLAALLVAAPMMAIIALAIKRDSDGPVVFRQSRVGKNGELFDVLKFRTMVQNAEQIKEVLAEENEGAGPLFKMKHDPRVTKVGRLLRKTSLDELPQLWNVVRSEMSLVGPRPALQSEMAGWDSDLYGRLRVKPGITGMWQVSGRSSTSFSEYTRLDLYYVDNWSLIVDLAILAKTIPAVLKSDGAY